jgi:proteic killer suppression protein
MEIDSIAHKGLRRFFEAGNAKGLVGDTDRLRKMLAFIDATASLEELATPPNYGLHELTGDRKGTWSMTVTKNWAHIPRWPKWGADRHEPRGLSWLLRCTRLSPSTSAIG